MGKALTYAQLLGMCKQLQALCDKQQEVIEAQKKLLAEADEMIKVLNARVAALTLDCNKLKTNDLHN